MNKQAKICIALLFICLSLLFVFEKKEDKPLISLTYTSYDNGFNANGGMTINSVLLSLDGKYKIEKAEYTSQYPLSLHLSDKVYYTGKVDGLRGDQVIKINLKNGKKEVLTNDFYAVNMLVPFCDNLLVAAVKYGERVVRLYQYNEKNNEMELLIDDENFYCQSIAYDENMAYIIGTNYEEMVTLQETINNSHDFLTEGVHYDPEKLYIYSLDKKMNASFVTSITNVDFLDAAYCPDNTLDLIGFKYKLEYNSKIYTKLNLQNNELSNLELYYTVDNFKNILCYYYLSENIIVALLAEEGTNKMVITLIDLETSERTDLFECDKINAYINNFTIIY